jgi:phosphoribosyl 1,2-cyclic phosphodiesterase
MRVKFWGVRGSIACPGPHTVRYGGNTICIELRFSGLDRLIIIDAGSGIRELGNFLLANDMKKGPLSAELYLSHTHWDHIMGFPFFTPIYIPSTTLKVYGPVTHEGDSLESMVGGQMTYRYFPIRRQELAAGIEYINLKECSLELGDGIGLSTKYLNHPVLCLGYRFDYKGKSLCTLLDTEPFRNLFCSDPADPSYDPGLAEEGKMVAEEQNRLVEQFFQGADLVIHDAQYTKEEYDRDKIGWGHTDMDYAIASAARAGVKKLVLIHHDPMRIDEALEELAKELRKKTVDTGMPEIVFAREGMEITL